MSEKKWKDALLKSSLPLEHEVSVLLARLKWHVWGQFSYARNNESGRSVDFSVDIDASREYSTDTHWLANLQIFLECKYTSPGAKWLFLPYPKTPQIGGDAVQTLDQLANKRVTDSVALFRMENGSPYCIRGISIFEGGVDESSIHRGVMQLRYAMPNMVIQAFSSQLNCSHDVDLNVTFGCAILVTSAPTFVLKNNVTISDVQDAESLDTMIEEVESVILWESHSPDRRNYTKRLLGSLDLDSVKKRIDGYAAVFKPTDKIEYPPAEYQVSSALFEAGDHVFVVSLKNLEKFLKRLDKAATNAAKSIQHIATLELNKKTMATVIGPYPPNDSNERVEEV